MGVWWPRRRSQPQPPSTRPRRRREPQRDAGWRPRPASCQSWQCRMQKAPRTPAERHGRLHGRLRPPGRPTAEKTQRASMDWRDTPMPRAATPPRALASTSADLASDQAPEHSFRGHMLLPQSCAKTPCKRDSPLTLRGGHSFRACFHLPPGVWAPSCGFMQLNLASPLAAAEMIDRARPRKPHT